MAIFVSGERNMLDQIEGEERNWDANGSAGLSTWILKSPVSTNSCGVVTATDRNELNSSMKALGFAE